MKIELWELSEAIHEEFKLGQVYLDFNSSKNIVITYKDRKYYFSKPPGFPYGFCYAKDNDALDLSFNEANEIFPSIIDLWLKKQEQTNEIRRLGIS